MQIYPAHMHPNILHILYNEGVKYVHAYRDKAYHSCTSHQPTTLPPEPDMISFNRQVPPSAAEVIGEMIIWEIYVPMAPSS